MASQSTTENAGVSGEAPAGWGQLEKCESYGKPFDQPEDFAEVDFQESITRLANHRHAAHAMFYMFDDDVLWDLSAKKGSVLMQMRFDGAIGFPGGLLDSVKDGQEDPVTGLNRELEEEAALDTNRFAIKQTDHVFTHVNQRKRLVLHFYAKEVTKEEFGQIEQGVMKAADWGIETLGTIRVPLYIMPDGYRGFPVFLANKLCGNAKQQLLQTIARRQILSEKEVQDVVAAHENYVKNVANTPSGSADKEVKLDHYASHYGSDYKLIDYSQAIDKYRHYTHACHAMLYASRPNPDQCLREARLNTSSSFILMHMRFDGFLGFYGGLCEAGETPEEGINRELEEEIGLDLKKHRITHDDLLLTHLNEKTQLCLYFYTKEVPWQDLHHIEQHLHQAPDYGAEVLGPVRVPVHPTPSPDVAICLANFLTHRFIGNTSDQLLYTLRHLQMTDVDCIQKALVPPL